MSTNFEVVYSGLTTAPAEQEIIPSYFLTITKSRPK